jgi:two-component system, OmpR family, sensor histidine kinase KdpD
MQTKLNSSVEGGNMFTAATDRTMAAAHRTMEMLPQDFRSGMQPSASLFGSCLAGLLLVAVMTMCLVATMGFVELRHVSMAYLIPVLIAATKLGIIPAILTAIGAVAASAFVLYPPIYNFRIADPQQLLDLPLFVIVAAVTGQLAARCKVQAMVAGKRADETQALYAFSKKLAAAADADEIYDAIEQHLSLITGCRVVYFGTEVSASRASRQAVPEALHRALATFTQTARGREGVRVDDPASGAHWHVRPVSARHLAFGVLAIDVSQIQAATQTYFDRRIDEALADAATRLERLDVARLLGEANLRAQAETFRAALIGSVTHGLRTPLASIMGSASILVQAPAIARDPHLSALAGIVRDETERLNGDIQKLLDASRISSAAVRTHMTWADPADIVNAAIAGLGRGLSRHRLCVQLPDALGLVQIDPVLIEQALRFVLDNAAKYSPAGSTISIDAQSYPGEIRIAVRDEGVGLSERDRKEMFERFYRGARTRDTTPGSGLGLWIARAFVVACNGRLEAVSGGASQGTTVTIVLPETEAPAALEHGRLDD